MTETEEQSNPAAEPRPVAEAEPIAESGEQMEEAGKPRMRVQLNKTLPDSRLIKLEQHLEALRAYSKAHKTFRRPLRYVDFQDLVTYHATMVSGLNKFFEELGLVVSVKGKPGYYTPTEKLIEFDNALEWKDEARAKKIMKEVVETSWFWQDAKVLLETRERVSEDDLLKRFASTSAAQQQHKNALKILLDYLTFADLVRRGEQGDYTLVMSSSAQDKESGIETPRIGGAVADPKKMDAVVSVADKPAGRAVFMQKSDLQVSIEVKVDSTTSPERLREIIKTIKEALHD